jgi:hypothetical protein
MVRILIGHHGTANVVIYSAPTIHTFSLSLLPAKVLIISGLLPVEIVHAVRTGHLTIPAPYAPVIVGEDEAVFTFMPGCYRANLDAWGIIAMITQPG